MTGNCEGAVNAMAVTTSSRSALAVAVAVAASVLALLASDTAQAIAPPPTVVTFEDQPRGTSLDVISRVTGLKWQVPACHSRAPAEVELYERNLTLTAECRPLTVTFPQPQAFVAMRLLVPSILNARVSTVPRQVAPYDVTVTAKSATGTLTHITSSPEAFTWFNATVRDPSGAASITSVTIDWGSWPYLHLDDFAYSATAQPDTEITAAPPALTAAGTASFRFVGTPGSSFRCTLNGRTEACKPPRDYTGLADGLHTFEVVAIDSYGNPDTTPARTTWRVDLLAPETEIAEGPAGPTASASAAFAFRSNEEGSSFLCSLDGAPEEPCASPRQYGGLSNGPHTFTVRAVDQTGKADPTPATRAWTVAAEYIASLRPPGGTAEVLLDASLNVTFTQSMDAASIDARRFTLVGPGGPVAATVTYDAVGRRAVLTPRGPLAELTTYTARLRGGPDGVRTAAGAPLPSDIVWGFTTGRAEQDGDGIPAPPDNCPTVANVGQADGDRDGVGDACEVGRPGTIAPKAGESVGVKVEKGEVFVRMPEVQTSLRATGIQPDDQGFQPLKGIANIPTGATLDTRAGTIAMTAASTSAKGPRQATGRFSVAIFKIRQERATQKLRRRKVSAPLELVLQTPPRGAREAGCVPGRRPGSGIVRTLSGSTTNAFFRSIGFASMTTVRSAAWVTKDRCDGTLTSVGRGRADVFDLRRKRTRPVTRGRSYLARGSFLSVEGPKGRPRG